jgi:D-glycero-alpha-D-manno-heptose-7-phosphate kinase
MIVTKTPLRISFFGGGSDIPQFYNDHPGLVISTAINKHIYIAANHCVANHIKLVYSEMEYPKNIADIKHDRIREVLRYMGIANNIEIASFSDVPTKGTGLGSSSTFTVGILAALAKEYGFPYNKRDLAELACHIEIDKCNEPIGKQDQYAAAYGGFNVIRFDKDKVSVTPVPIGIEVLDKLQYNLFAYNTGINRQASSILSSQVDNLKSGGDTIENTKVMVDLAEEALGYLINSNLNSFGELLDKSWTYKKKLSENISNIHIDKMYETAMSGGALGGKLLGAGGGGYMLFYVPEEEHYTFTKKMNNYERFKFKFVEYGSTVEMFNNDQE